MVPLMSLWLPILLSAVFTFVLSSIVHMVLKYHQADYKKMGPEDEFLEAMRRLNLAPGDYLVPCARSPQEMKDPAYIARRDKGPMVFMTVIPGGAHGMGGPLGKWFVFTLIVGVFAAYIAGRALGPGANYLDVFRFAGTMAFACYAMAAWPFSIWYQRSVATNLRNSFDALLYAGVTAGTFGWLWPK